MKQIQKVAMPMEFEYCKAPSHWFNLIVLGTCYQCEAKLAADEDEDEDVENDEDDDGDTEETVDAIHGVGDERSHQPMTEAEVDAMFEEEAQTRSEAYHLGNS
jgi:hypothetical protein